MALEPVEVLHGWGAICRIRTCPTATANADYLIAPVARASAAAAVNALA